VVHGQAKAEAATLEPGHLPANKITFPIFTNMYYTVEAV
jgi:hypothetical protein